jgi:hypothetical protein
MRFLGRRNKGCFHRAFGPTSAPRSHSSVSCSVSATTVSCREPAVALLRSR